jgi:nitrate reductase NapE component
MNTAMIIATRELRERWRIFVIAVAFAVLPFVIAAMPGGRNDPANTIVLLGGTGALSFAFGVALLLGGTTIARDLAEKRLSFYFTKPIAPWALWVGKAGAALVTLAISVAIIAVPAFLAVPDEWRMFWGRESWLVARLSVVAAIAFFLIAHAMATMVRSRSVLMALDLVLAVATVLMALLVTRPLLVRGAVEYVVFVWAALAAAALLILAIAPIVQLTRARTDIRRSHAVLSGVLWPAIAVCLLIAYGYALWATSPALASLDDIENVDQSRTGEWVFVTGTDKTRGDISSSFLLNTKTGENERLNALRWTGVEFSRSGNVLAWIEADELVPRTGAARVHVRPLTAGGEPRATPIIASMGEAVLLSDDGTRIAVLHGQKLRVHDIATGRLLAAAQMPRAIVVSAFFASPATVRFVSTQRTEKIASIHELDITRKTLTKTGQFETAQPIGYYELTASADGSTLYVNQTGKIIDGRTGALRATVPIATKSHRASVMLHDGRVAWLHDGVLDVFDANGGRVKQVRLPITGGIVVGETADGKVLISGRQGKPAEGVRGRKMITVDLARGAVTGVKDDVFGPSNWWGRDPRLPMFAAGASYSGIGGNEQLTHWR